MGAAFLQGGELADVGLALLGRDLLGQALFAGFDDGEVAEEEFVFEKPQVAGRVDLIEGMGNGRVVESTDDAEKRVGGTEAGQELLREPPALGVAGLDPGDLGKFDRGRGPLAGLEDLGEEGDPLVGDLDHGDLFRSFGRGRSGGQAGQGGEQGRFSRLRQTDKANLHSLILFRGGSRKTNRREHYNKKTSKPQDHEPDEWLKTLLRRDRPKANIRGWGPEFRSGGTDGGSQEMPESPPDLFIDLLPPAPKLTLGDLPAIRERYDPGALLPGGGRIGQNEAMRPFKVGVDSYALKPLGLDPFELLDWAIINGADGVQFSEAPREASDKSFFRELADYAAQNVLYLEWGGGEHVPFDLATGKPKDILAGNERAVQQAVALGVKTIRSCSGGLMRWRKDLPSTEALLRESARELRRQRPMFRDHGINLAVETHFEFTTFELLRLFDMAGAEPGGGLGICLDTMNLLTMLEDPVSAAARVLPWVVTTHIKDGGIVLAEDGFITFTAESGRGVVDLRAIFEMLSSAPEKEIHLSIEDHGGDFRIPIFDPDFRAGFPDLEVGELCSLLKLARRTQALVDGEKLAALDRLRWPAVCAERVKRDLEAVRKIIEELCVSSIP